MPVMTITTTAQQGNRVAAAIGHRLGLGRDATAQECKDWVISQIRGVVHDYEYRQAQAAISLSAMEPT